MHEVPTFFSEQTMFLLKLLEGRVERIALSTDRLVDPLQVIRLRPQMLEAFFDLRVQILEASNLVYI